MSQDTGQNRRLSRPAGRTSYGTQPTTGDQAEQPPGKDHELI
jgi:hypothetical protein